ncbi:MAG: acetyltransferase [Sterolibacteriaceae bacterium]|nr:acetyltransferase [Sterolibacteriaceae bacterium]
MSGAEVLAAPGQNDDRPLVIFGTGALSSLAWYVFTHDSPREVAGFAVDASHRRGMQSLHGLPVVDFEDVAAHFPPDAFAISIPTGWTRMNALRADRFVAARAAGYAFASYVSSRALVWPDLELGANCMIHDGAIVQPFTRIGDNCIVRSGAHVSHHCTIADHCFIAARAVIAGEVTVGEGCVLGANCTLRDGVSLSAGCFVGAGAVLARNTDKPGLYLGSPARWRGDAQV